MIDTESEPGAWEREIAMRPKTQEAGGRVMSNYTTDGSEIPLRSAQMLNQQDETIAALRARVARLEAALEWYAAQAQRIRDWQAGKIASMGGVYALRDDGGDRWRAALAKQEGE